MTNRRCRAARVMRIHACQRIHRSVRRRRPRRAALLDNRNAREARVTVRGGMRLNAHDRRKEGARFRCTRDLPSRPCFDGAGARALWRRSRRAPVSMRRHDKAIRMLSRATLWAHAAGDASARTDEARRRSRQRSGQTYRARVGEQPEAQLLNPEMMPRGVAEAVPVNQRGDMPAASELRGWTWARASRAAVQAYSGAVITNWRSDP
jgi:hypothetical protein